MFIIIVVVEDYHKVILMHWVMGGKYGTRCVGSSEGMTDTTVQ